MEPRAVPRRTGLTMRLKSSFVSQRFSTFFTSSVRVFSSSRLRRISATPKTPTATETKLMPLYSSKNPKVKRGWPL